MYIYFGIKINELLYWKSDYGSSNLFPFEDGTRCGNISKEPFSFDNSYPENDFDDYYSNEERIFNDNNQKRGILRNNDTSNLEKKSIFLWFWIKMKQKLIENHLIELMSNKPKIKNIFVVKKEISTTPKDIKSINDIPPEFFDEKSINDMLNHEKIINLNVSNAQSADLVFGSLFIALLFIEIEILF